MRLIRGSRETPGTGRKDVFLRKLGKDSFNRNKSHNM